jgi:hypothetical protein
MTGPDDRPGWPASDHEPRTTRLGPASDDGPRMTGLG